MTTENKLGPGGMIVAGVIMLVVAGVVIALQFNELSVRKEAEAAREWPKVSALIVESRPTQLRDSTKANAKIWVPYTRYRYSVDGVEYTGERFRFIAPGRDGFTKSMAERDLKNYPKGKNTKVHVDPKDPTNSVIWPGIRWTSYGWIFIVAGIIFGLAGIFVALLGTKKKFLSG